LYLGGIVRYTDTPAAYEDFTDPWDLPLVHPCSHRYEVWPYPANEVWRYPQRIDVHEWLHYVPEGVVVPGVVQVVGVPCIHRAAFQIEDDQYEEILHALEGAERGRI
jgi:hypothetical protein